MNTPRLTEVFVLREDSRGNIKRLLKLSDDIAGRFQQTYGKHAFTMARFFKERYGHLLTSPEATEELLQRFFGGTGVIIWKWLLNDPSAEDKLKKVDKMLDAMRLAREAMRKKQAVDVEKQSVLKFPDGWNWVKLEGQSQCTHEGDLMGHCGFDERGDMYSLRDPTGKPHVTLTYEKGGSMEGGVIHQIKGKENETPDHKYWPYVKQFVQKFKAHESMFGDEDPLDAGTRNVKAFLDFIFGK